MITLPQIPYSFDALMPYIDAQTVEIHYTKHHQGYVNKLNELIAGTEFADMELVDIIKKAPQGPIFNNAAQIWNHSFYRESLRKSQENNAPTGSLKDAIEKTWGSFDTFKEKFTASAVGNFGSGRTWLVKNPDGSLEIINTSNAQTIVTTDKNPLFVIDVREHAYYLKYQNRRPEYVSNFWNLVNRDFAAKNLA